MEFPTLTAEEITTSTVFEHATWYQAAPLQERRAAAERLHRQGLPVESAPEPAQKRLATWKADTWFAAEGLFAQRLEAEHLDEETFLEILGITTATLKQSRAEPPAWLRTLEEAYTNPPVGVLPATFLENPGFLGLVEPLIARGALRIQDGVDALARRYANLPFDPGAIVEIMLPSLLQQLPQVSFRTLILELNVARLRGLLQGDTPEERHRSFFPLLRQKDFALAILQEYPALAQQAVLTVDRWVDVSLEFLERLCEDWPRLKATFTPEAEPGVLAEYGGGAGDTHRGGRTVAIATFESGFKLVYKPRSMAIDVRFQQLLEWLNERGDHPPFRTLTILDRKTHGWVEFVVHETCKTSDELRRFYIRQGGLTALLFVLEATDFHFENIIAAGEHPVLIDLESLFHPRWKRTPNRLQPSLPGHHMMAHSVLRTGILPQRILQTRENVAGIDLSGLNSPVGQQSPFAVPMVENQGTDEMCIVRKHYQMYGSHNLPTENPVSLSDRVEELTDGFERVYRLFLEHRQTLLAAEGPLSAFADCEVRVILRATNQYMRVLQESFHPDMLRDALDRERLFDSFWAIIEQVPKYTAIVPHEQYDLWQRDVPFFTTRPDALDLFTSTGRRIPDFFDEPGMTAVQACIEQLGEEDLERQLWFIRGSIAAAERGLGEKRWPTYEVTTAPVPPTPEQLLETACAVGDRLDVLALQDEENDIVSWIGLTLLGEKHWVLAPVGIDIYSGLSGITLFLAYLGALTGEGRYTALAQRGLNTVKKSVEQLASLTNTLGAFDGWGAPIYLYTHLAALWNDETLLREAEAVVQQVFDHVAEDEAFDIINGSAGCMLALLSLHRRAPSARTLAAAMACGDHLLATAQPMEPGVGWFRRHSSSHEDKAPLTGFSHGAAGIATALLELGAVSGKERYRAGALQALAYERSHFIEEEGNWSDLREDDDQPTDGPRCLTAWCHGAPGIGLGRLRSLPHLDDDLVRVEIRTAVQTTLREGFGGTHCLCHGDLGNLELLQRASETFDDEALRQQVGRLTGVVRVSIDRHGWLCGVPLGIETPGLMTGLAGIGYGLLRRIAPERVPAVLTLDPPVDA